GHEPGAVDDLSATAKDLLGVTAAQGTRAPVGELVDDGDFPALRGALVRRCGAGHAGADDDQVVRVGHRCVPSTCADRSWVSPPGSWRCRRRSSTHAINTTTPRPATETTVNRPIATNATPPTSP